MDEKYIADTKDGVQEGHEKKILPIKDNNYLLEKKSGQKIHFFYTGAVSSEKEKKRLLILLQKLLNVQRPFIPQMVTYTFVEKDLWIGYEYYTGTLFSQKILEDGHSFSVYHVAKIFYKCALAIQSLHHLRYYGLAINSECFIFDESYENIYFIHWAKNILFPDEVISHAVENFSTLEKDILSLGYTFYLLVIEKKAALSQDIYYFFNHFFDIDFCQPIDSKNDDDKKILSILIKTMAQGDNQFMHASIDELIEDIKRLFFFFSEKSYIEKEKKYSSVDKIIAEILKNKFFFSIPEIYKKMSCYENQSSINFEIVSRIVMRDFYFSLFIFREANEHNKGKKSIDKAAIENIHNATFYIGINRIVDFFRTCPSITTIENKKKLNNMLELWTICSFQGYVAEKICLVMNYSVNAEFVRLCTVYYSIGEFVVLTLLPGVWEKIRRAAATKNCSLEEESQRVLSFSFSQISVALAKKYSFSERFINFLKKSTPEKEASENIVSKNLTSRAKKIWGIAHFSIDLSQIFSQFFNEKSKIYLSKVKDNFSQYFSIDFQNVNEILVKASGDFLQNVEDTLIKSTTTYKKISLFQEYGMDFFELHHKKEKKKVASPVRLPQSNQDTEYVPFPQKESEDFSIYMENVQQEIDQVEVHDILKNVKKFLQVELVVLCSYQPNINGFLATHAVGQHNEEYVGQFKILPQETKNIFHIAISTHTEVLVDSIDDPKLASLIPIWYRMNKNYVRSFLFLPFKIHAACHHAILCGHKEKNALCVLPRQIETLKAFSNVFVAISAQPT